MLTLLGCARLGCVQLEDVVAVGENPGAGVSGAGTSSAGASSGSGGATGGATGGSGGLGAGGQGGTPEAGGSAGATGTGGQGGQGGTGHVESGIVEFGFAPTNFDPAVYRPSVSTESIITLDCGTSTFDSSTLTFGNWCDQVQPAPGIEQQPDGPEIVILPIASITVASGSTLRLIGSRPVVFAVFGDALIAGTIDVNASGTTPGAGGNWSCGASQGGDGSGSTVVFGGASGGGGGGYGTAGGKSGAADTDATQADGAEGGVSRGNDSISPLLGGCAGGRAGGCEAPGGAGGGAIQISAARTLTITGAVFANGGTGATPCNALQEGGGTGGGSGGAILLEARSVMTSGAALEVNGGDGGSNGAFAGIYSCGAHAGGSGAKSASEAARDSIDCQGGSPGGGGGYGRVQILER